MWHGMFLFMLGLLTGFVEQRFANIRMGLAAHLEGVTNGIFLLALGTAWTEVRLAPPAKANRSRRAVWNPRRLGLSLFRCIAQNNPV